VTEARRLLGNLPGLEFASSQSEALEGSDALVIVTEWKEFKSPEFDAISRVLRNPVIFDGRNLYEPELMASFGIEYHGIGRGVSEFSVSSS